MDNGQGRTYWVIHRPYQVVHRHGSVGKARIWTHTVIYQLIQWCTKYIPVYDGILQYIAVYGISACSTRLFQPRAYSSPALIIYCVVQWCTSIYYNHKGISWYIQGIYIPVQHIIPAYYGMYLVYDGIWWYNAVYCSVWRHIANSKSLHNLRIRTQYLMHTGVQTKPQSY